MGTLRSSAFDMQLSNTPLLNLRMEFNASLSMVRTPGFADAFCPPMRAVSTRWMTWYGMPGPFLSLLVQRATLGLESYVPAMVFMLAGQRGMLSKEILDAIRTPARLGGGTAEACFNKLPGLISDAFPLRIVNPALWERTRVFYREVRNPLFHGYEISGENGPRAVTNAIEHLALLYGWIDSWSDIEQVWPGASALAQNQSAQ